MPKIEQHELAGPGTRSERPSSGFGSRAPLPIPLTPLIAREQELTTVVGLLHEAGVRLQTLTGPGGVGKTRLAIAAAASASDGYRDGVAFVNLAPLANSNLVLDTIAGTLGLRDMGGAALHDRLLDALVDKHLLLMLDNFEQVVTAGPGVRDLLGPCAGVTMLLTSRTVLRVSGEREFPVSPLPFSTPSIGDDAELAGGIRLFFERAQAVRPDFQLTAATLPTVGAIVNRVDGLPLAIELAAARTNALPPAALLERLEQRLPLLSGGARDLPLRQQTMRDTIGWSYDLLPPAEQTFLRRLAVFVGGFTLAAAEALCLGVSDGPGGVQPPARNDTVDLITSLIDHSLLQSATSGGEPRYSMLETVREFARDRLDASEEGDAIHRAHAAFFLAFAEAADERPSPGVTTAATVSGFWALRLRLAGSRLARWLDRLEAEHDNLRAALNWQAHRGEPRDFLRLARSLSIFWLFRGPFEEGRTWLEQARARDDASSPLLWRDAMYGLGLLTVNQDDAVRAESCFGECLAVARAQGDAAGVAFGGIGLGLVAMQRRQFGEATTHFEEALTRARRLDDTVLGSFCAGLVLSYLGALAYARGAQPLATVHFEGALREQRAVDDRWG